MVGNEETLSCIFPLLRAFLCTGWVIRPISPDLVSTPVYKMLLGGFLTVVLSKSLSIKFKITQVLSCQPASNDVIAKSNMAATDHDKNPNFWGCRSI